MGSLAHFNTETESLDHIDVTQPLKVEYSFDHDATYSYAQMRTKNVYTRTAVQSGRYIGLSRVAAEECVAWIRSAFLRNTREYSQEFTPGGLKDFQRRSVSWPTATIVPNSTWFDVSWSISDVDTYTEDTTGGAGREDPTTQVEIKAALFAGLVNAGIESRKYFRGETEPVLTNLLPQTGEMHYDGGQYVVRFDQASYSYKYISSARTVTELVVDPSLVGYTLFPEDASATVVNTDFDWNAHKGQTVELRSSSTRYVKLILGGLV